MAKSETPKLLTFNKAQKYLAEKGIELSTQQVRNLARTNEYVMAGVTDYTDPITDSTAKVIDASAIDRYIDWRASNPEVVRSGRKADGTKKYSGKYTPDQIASINALLSANGFTPLEIPVVVKRGPRKPKNASETPATDNGSVSSDVDLSELELIEVA